MATAGSIVIDLLMKTGSFETDSKRAEQRMKQLSKEAVTAGTAIGTAFAGAATALTALVASSINSMDELSKTAHVLGTSTEDFSKLAYAAGFADLSIQDLQSAFGRLTKAQVEALDAGSQQAKVFDALGISIQDANGQLRPTTDLLYDFADAFQRQKGSQEVVAAGMAIFGKSFQNMIDLLKDGSQGLRDAGAEALAFGQVVSSDAGAMAEQFNDNLARMKLFVTGVGNAVAADLLPDLERLTNQFVDSARSGQAVEDTAQGISDVIRVMGSAMEVAMKPIQALDDLIQGLTIGMVGLAEAGKGVIGLDWDRIKIGWDVANNGADLAYYGRDRVGRDGRGATPAVPKVNFIDPADLLAQDKQAVEQLRQARAEAERLRKLAFGDAPKGGKGTKSRAGTVREEQDAVTKLMADYDALYGTGNEKAAGFIAQLEREIALHGDVSEAARVSYDIQTGAFGQLSEAQAELLRNLAAVKDAQDDYAALYGDGMQKMADDTRSATDGMRTVTDQAVRNMQDAFADFLFDPFKDGLGGMVDGFAKTLQKMAAQAAASQIFQMIGSWASGYSGTGASWVNAIGGAISGSAGGRAGGGPVAAGSMYRVGEGGRPELFDQGGKTYLIPGDAGSVRPITAGLPASSMGSGGGITNQFNTTLNVTSDGSSSTQQGDGSEDARRIQQFFTQMINQWAVQQSRPGGMFHQMRTGG
ncbi:hypothetical protein D7Y57_18870 [Stenotrophomonas maltophilia]|nr:hypothetical protein DF40_022430 [Stenotrophomonas maltophilia M30]MBA0458173.1 hypothetical protein [Stenotrophomonas maltophilia]